MASVNILSSTSPLQSTQAEQISDLNANSKQGHTLYAGVLACAMLMVKTGLKKFPAFCRHHWFLNLPFRLCYIWAVSQHLIAGLL